MGHIRFRPIEYYKDGNYQFGCRISWVRRRLQVLANRVDVFITHTQKKNWFKIPRAGV